MHQKRGALSRCVFGRNVITNIAEGTYDTGVQYPLTGQSALTAGTPAPTPAFAPALPPTSGEARHPDNLLITGWKLLSPLSHVRFCCILCSN